VRVLVERAGVALNVAVEGEGAAVVLLHGHTLDLRVWDGIVPALVRRGLRVIRYDQRGHGRSSSPASGYRWSDHAADAGEVIEGLAAAPAHIVGLSKGGGIALELAVRRPELVRSLILMGPMVPDFALSEELAGFFRTLARAIRTEGVQPALHGLWLSHPLLAPAVAMPGARALLEAMIDTYPAGEYFASGRDAPDREWRLTDRLGEITAPTLVVSGERDVADFRAMAGLLVESLPGSVHEVVAGCGHLVPLERPQQAAEIVLRFLGSSLL
jgi:pimeloyl-ACP methyl ester carboxylesterase